jgi:hypothetical protein
LNEKYDNLLQDITLLKQKLEEVSESVWYPDIKYPDIKYPDIKYPDIKYRIV